jgi:hypothetical protein
MKSALINGMMGGFMGFLMSFLLNYFIFALPQNITTIKWTPWSRQKEAEFKVVPVC